MKKNIVVGLFAAGLIVAGGTGFYLGNGKEPANSFSMMGSNQVTPMMNTTNMQGVQQLIQKSNQNQGQTFEQMLPFMKKLHPNLSDKELKDLYDSMMGTNGTPSCSAMMGSLGRN